MHLVNEHGTIHFSVILHIYDVFGNRKTIVKHKDNKTWELEYKENDLYKHIRCNTLENLCSSQNIDFDMLLEYMPELVSIGDVFK